MVNTDVGTAWESSFFDQKLDFGLVINDRPFVSIVLGVDGIKILDVCSCTGY